MPEKGEWGLGGPHPDPGISGDIRVYPTIEIMNEALK
jgi:hypothetical protein